MFVIGIDGSNITVGECNIEGAHCQIRWGNVISKTTITPTEIRVAPSVLNTITTPVPTLSASINASDYLLHYATVTPIFADAKTKNGVSIQAWKLPWTDSSNSKLKLETISSTITIKNKVVNHVGTTWYEYETGTGTRGFVYSGDVTLLPYPTHPDDKPVTNISTDTAKLVVIWKNPGKITLTQGGFVLKNSSGAILKTVTENVPSSYQTASDLPCSYEMKTEYGYTLQPNTTYYYKMYVIDSSGNPYETEGKFTTNAIPVTGVSVTPANRSLTLGSTLQLSASVTPSNSSNKSVTWKSSNTAVATVSSSGVVTAKGIGTATITATAADGSGKSGSATITINCNHSSTVTLPAIAPSCTATGLTEGKKCSTCGTVTLAQQTINPKGHSWNAATCTAAKKCKTCGATDGSALGHTYKDAYDATCEVCNAEREVPMRSVPMYRMYDPNPCEHFYTGSAEERDGLVKVGWKYEGVGFNFPVAGKPVYRLYDPVYGEHLYTMDEDEMNKLLAKGWNYENVAFNSAGENEVPQYRLHNPNAKRGGYHFTGSIEERDWLVSLGWVYQGIGWYSCWE